VLRPVFETELLVLDELGAVKPTEWVWDTGESDFETRAITITATTIITTNFPNLPQQSSRVTWVPGIAKQRTTRPLKRRLGQRIGAIECVPGCRKCVESSKWTAKTSGKSTAAQLP